MPYENEKLIEFNNYIKDKKVAIIGLGISNVPLIDYLYDLGAEITVFDNKPIDTIDKKILDKIYEYKLNSSFGENYLTRLKGFNVIFRSPSCRPDLPELILEKDKGTIITSEIEMAIELSPCKIIGVTGTKGKATTARLIYEMLKEQEYECFLGGNIGIPMFTEIKDLKPEDILVLSLSSFQLLDIQKSPDIAVITNLDPNHLEFHTSYEEYIDSKSNIFNYQNEKDILVLNYENNFTNSFSQKAISKIIYFSSARKLINGIIVDENIIKLCENGLRKHILNLNNLPKEAIENAENICAAICTTKELVEIGNQIKAIEKFKW